MQNLNEANTHVNAPEIHQAWDVIAKHKIQCSVIEHAKLIMGPSSVSSLTTFI